MHVLIKVGLSMLSDVQIYVTALGTLPSSSPAAVCFRDSHTAVQTDGCCTFICFSSFAAVTLVTHIKSTKGSPNIIM